ncbi:hypothetical protein E7T06_13085 [Deinococcus sp. Arct2-2]|uniref:hypothetical protein n=1 Tax=Deinococcus sp. Arct2-2 TaxID=2568653 RepID=UPI0010A2CE62|nr:hypothetical protein [Deinococcus sp. Arct2-2]THF69203.1 hypothetical protein E7T06_13085 [Deinococcus sp. Arct2-2]
MNRFAVSANDLKGEWSSDAGGMTQWVNSSTGLSAGATGFASNVIGAQTFQSAASGGKLAIKRNWQITFSEIEHKPRVYNAYFEAGKGGQRVL